MWDPAEFTRVILGKYYDHARSFRETATKDLVNEAALKLRAIIFSSTPGKVRFKPLPQTYVSTINFK